MESSFQKIIAAIVGVMILFIIPVYIAFEKVDDVSYSLVLKLTQNFVDNVRDKGYISPEMYSDFVSGLYATNNAYDVNIEHIKKRYDPAIYIYDRKENGTDGSLLHVLDYNKYAPDGKVPDEITIDVGVYNQKNSNIDIDLPSMTKSDGSVINYKNGGSEILTAEQLYKLKIDEYKRLNRIILSRGEVYADVDKVTGSKFDEEIYIPSRITLNPGRISIKNKQGNEPGTLDYGTYISNYDRAVKNNTVFNGPTYNNSNSSINYTRASMRIKGTNTSANEAENLYYDWIDRYNQEKTNNNGYDGRIIESTGEVYADLNKVNDVNNKIDTRIDILADISKEQGTITINGDKQKEGYETTLEYDKYISNYDNNQEMVAFAGEIYNDSNSNISVTNHAFWTGSKTYDELSNSEKSEAANKYNSQILDLNSDYNKYGKMTSGKNQDWWAYAINQNVEGYNPVTDTISDYTLNGYLGPYYKRSNDPVRFDKDTFLRNVVYNEDDPKESSITYGGKYVNGQNGIEILHVQGSVKDNKISSNVIDYNGLNKDDLFDDIKTTVKEEIYIKLYSSNITIHRFRVRLSTGAYVYGTTFEQFADACQNNKMQYGGTRYDLMYIYTYPSYMILQDTQSNYTEYIYDANRMVNLAKEYYTSSSNASERCITVDISKEYNKSDLDITYDQLVIKKDGEEIYHFYENEDRNKYSEYLEEFQNENSITTDVKTFKFDEVTIDIGMRIDELYLETFNAPVIHIVDPENFKDFKYILEYYNTGRVVIGNPEVIESDEINIQHPRLVITDKNDNSLIYDFNGTDENDRTKIVKYIEEYNSKGTVTIEPSRTYTKDDVTVEREKLVIIPKDKKKNTITIEDNAPNYNEYLGQYESSGKIIVQSPEVYDIYDDLEVQDAHISITPSGYSNPIIDIYEKDNKSLFDNYVSQYRNNKKVTLQYNVSDLEVYRKNITIQVLEKSIMGGYTNKETKIIYDNTDLDLDGAYEYISFKNEFELYGLITFEPSEYYTADELSVVDPSVTVTDPKTGDVIVKYGADYSSLDDNSRYLIYNNRVDEYNSYGQIINKEITYRNGYNCIIKPGHIVNDEHITDKQIVDKLFKDTGVDKTEFLRQCLLGNGDMYSSLAYMNENSYIINEGDEINVTVKNRNKTIASIFYSLFTANVGDEEIAKIYVDYGGVVRNSGTSTFTEKAGIVDSKEGRLFKYQGRPEEVTLAPGKYTLECWGAAGGGRDNDPNSNAGGKAGKGAYSKEELTVIKETTLYVYVGGKGTMYSDNNKNNGGYNGGGNSYKGYGGGGATDIRLLKGETDDVNSLFSRIIVASGGGGASGVNSEGNGGNGCIVSTMNSPVSLQGANGYPEEDLYKGIGANRIDVSVGYDTYNLDGEIVSIDSKERGNLGIGGSVDFNGAGAGGGGYYGGSASHSSNAGGGGGLPYVVGIRMAAIHIGAEPYIMTYNINSLIKEYKTNKPNELNEITQTLIDHNVWSRVRDYGGTISYELLNVDMQGSCQYGMSMPNPLAYTGSSTMTGNLGNGYARIKKIG